jgi:hypothetical protein
MFARNDKSATRDKDGLKYHLHIAHVERYLLADLCPAWSSPDAVQPTAPAFRERRARSFREKFFKAGQTSRMTQVAVGIPPSESAVLTSPTGASPAMRIVGTALA